MRKKAQNWQANTDSAAAGITPDIASLALKGKAKFAGMKGDQIIENNKTIGSKGKARLLGFMIEAPNIPNISLHYVTVVHNEGKGTEHLAGEYAGTTNTRRRCIGFAIRLSGADASKYDIIYSAQTKSKSSEAKNGAFVGTAGKRGDAIEEMNIKIVAK